MTITPHTKTQSTIQSRTLNLKPISQTETPDQLAERNEQRKTQGLKKVNVITREKVAVLTKGTMIDAEMVQSRPDASYIMAGAQSHPRSHLSS